MRCECCNVILSPLEEKGFFIGTGNPTNSCFACLDTMDVPYDFPEDENHYEDVEEEPPLYDDEELWDER